MLKPNSTNVQKFNNKSNRIKNWKNCFFCLFYLTLSVFILTVVDEKEAQSFVETLKFALQQDILLFRWG